MREFPANAPFGLYLRFSPYSWVTWSCKGELDLEAAFCRQEEDKNGP